MDWGLVFPCLLLPISVKPLSGRLLVPLPSTLAEVHVRSQLMCFSGCILYINYQMFIGWILKKCFKVSCLTLKMKILSDLQED